MNRLAALALSLGTVLLAAAPGALASAAPALETDDHKTLYALGQALAQRLATYQLTPEDVALVQAGLADGLLDRPARAPLETYGPRIDALLNQRLQAVAEREKLAGSRYLDELAAEQGAVRTESGMVYLERSPGEGASPETGSTVTVHYEGRFRDGEVFDSSVGVGEPATFALTQVAPCFAEGLQRMKVGGKSRFGCPSELAYGDRGFPPRIPPGATLVFDVELISIQAPTPPAAAPDATPAP